LSVWAKPCKLKLHINSASDPREPAHDLPNSQLVSTIKMDNLLPSLLSFPPHPPRPTPMSDYLYDQGIRDQIDFVRKLADSKLLQQTSGGEDVLDVSGNR
jgi:hypothetical protein